MTSHETAQEYHEMSSQLNQEKTHTTTNGSEYKSKTARNVFVAVHSGAGNHSEANENHNKYICMEACWQAMDLLKKRNSAIDAVTKAVVTLEDDEILNAGYGSNLTVNGDAECEACLMDGKSLHFGAVGALTGVKNPVNVANLLVKEQSEGPLPFGRVRPSILVGKGAKTFCMDHDIDTNSNIISKSSFNTYTRYKKKCGLPETSNLGKRRRVEPTPVPKEKSVKVEKSVPNPSEQFQDTVGAICVDCEGNVAAASSTGGIWLKHSGRLGPVSTYGAGCWAQNKSSETKPGVAVVTSGKWGCGEHIMQTLLAKTCADTIRTPEMVCHSLPRVFTNDFLESEFLSSKPEKFGGILALKFQDTAEGKEVELGWIHSTNSFCIGYLGGEDKKPSAYMSKLDAESVAGKSCAMSGHLVFF